MNISVITDLLKQHKPSKSAGFFIGGCALGLALGAVLFAVLPNHNPPDEDDGQAASVVFERIVKQNELVSVSQRYSITDKATDQNSFFDLFDIPFTENSFWYRYAGTIKAGVNLQTAAFELDGKTVRITLDEPYVISNTPDMDESGVLEESNNILNPIHVEDVDAVQKKFQEDSQRYSIAGGLLEDAKANAEANLRGMFVAALGEDYSVEFTYRDGQGQGGADAKGDEQATGQGVEDVDGNAQGASNDDAAQQ